MKVSIIIPVYFNEENLEPLYEDLKSKFIDKISYEYEIIMIDDGSSDNSYKVMKDLSNIDSNIRIVRLSRNFGSHAAILCGLNYATGDCAVVKCADLQEPTELIIEMVESWKKGNNVVLAVREGRDESKQQELFANMYYWLVRKFALKTMPPKGFDVYLIDRKVIDVLTSLDETNSALTGQILWSGFKTDQIFYRRRVREIGEGKWTLKKKIRLVSDTLFSFSTLPISTILWTGVFSIAGAVIWSILVLILRINDKIEVTGWTTMFIFNLLSFGIMMLTLGIIGEYLWRTFDASKNRPTYIVEEDNKEKE